MLHGWQVALDILSNVLIVAAIVLGGLALGRDRRKIERERETIRRIALEREALRAPLPPGATSQEISARAERLNQLEYQRQLAAGARPATYLDQLTQRQDTELAVIKHSQPNLQPAFVVAVIGALLGLVAAVLGIWVQ